jgi:GDP-L-fucose synthase
MDKHCRIYVAGHRGLVGSAIVRNLEAKGYTNIIKRTHMELDLTNQQAVRDFFNKELPEYVILAAAKVGGIHANNTYPADFIYENLEIQNNVIKASHDYKVKKLLFLGSSCIYPKNCPQPIREEFLLSDHLESTNEAYAIAKIAGLKMCEFYKKQYGDNFISCMPTNLYGPNDNFDLKNSHVLPALVRKFHEAKTDNKAKVEIWGTGNPRREFLYVDDMADASVYLMENYNGYEQVNIGTGKDISIKALAGIIKDIIRYEGDITFNTNQPDGTYRKLLDVSKLNSLGWKYKVDLENGIRKTYESYLNEFQKSTAI